VFAKICWGITIAFAAFQGLALLVNLAAADSAPQQAAAAAISAAWVIIPPGNEQVMTLDDYRSRGEVPGLAGAAITFVLAWGYCAVTSGFLLGFGLGWIPAAIAAFIVFQVIQWLWLPLLLACCASLAVAVFAWVAS
jgi:hypothetical protein